MKKTTLIFFAAIILLTSCTTTKTTPVDSFILEGTAAYENQSYTLAEKYFNQALEIDESNEIALNNQILVYDQLNEINNALKLSDLGIKYYPNNAKFYHIKAQLLKKQNKENETIKLYQQILEIVPYSKKYNLEYLNLLLKLYNNGDNSIKDDIKKESLFLINNKIETKESLIALSTVDPENQEYSILLYNENPKEWNKIYLITE